MAGWTWDRVVASMGSDRTSGDGRGFAPLQEVRAYWEGLRDGPALPSRGDVDPRGLQAALEHVFLIERIAPGIARFRLAGMHLSDLMGMEVRGMPLTALIEPQGRAGIEALVEQVFSAPAIVEVALEAERGLGRAALQGRMLLLPLTDDGVCDKALGCLVTLGALGRTPRRFAVSRQRTEAVTVTASAPTQRVPAFAESPAPFTPAPKARPHLRLVKSDD
jgi:hypothetical protein